MGSGIHTPEDAKDYLGRFCAFDIGTVTCRMLVADAHSSNDGRILLSELCKEYEIVNLGEGVDSTGRLKDEALTRTASVLERFIDVRDSFDTSEKPITSTRAIATSATRDAENSDAFAAIMEDLGIGLQVASGDAEAMLSFLGAASAFPDERSIIVDVGGGSTEVTCGIWGADIEYSHSFEIGSRRMTERFWDGYPCSPSRIEDARKWARGVFSDIPKNVDCKNAHLVAVAGTATSAVTIDLGMEVYNPDIVNGSIMHRQRLSEIRRDLGAMSLDELRGVAGLDPRRAPVIVAGFVVLEEAMEALDANEFMASESDILEGIVMYNASHSQ